MKTHIVFMMFVLLSAAVAMGSPLPGADRDWVDRMAAQTHVAGLDWADRMAAAAGVAGIRPDDWIDRQIAIRRAEVTPPSVSQVEKVQLALIEAEGAKDLARALALFAGDAVVMSGGRTYSGIEEIRTYWENSAPFRAGDRWAGYSPTYKVRIEAGGDRATLQFDCVWIDVGTRQAQARSYTSNVLVRQGGRWVIKEMDTRIVRI